MEALTFTFLFVEGNFNFDFDSWILLTIFIIREFNIHGGVGGSIFSVLDDLKTIWEYAIKNYLDINLRDLNQYKAVLIIPDVYSRKRIKEMSGLIFKMGFSACFLSESILKIFKIQYNKFFFYLSSGACSSNIWKWFELRMCCWHWRPENQHFLRWRCAFSSKYTCHIEIWRWWRDNVLLLVASESFISIQRMSPKKQPRRGVAESSQGIFMSHRLRHLWLTRKKLHH